MNLWQKIIEVRKSIDALTKDKEGYQYSYVTGNQILGKIKAMMDEQQLILQPSTQVGEYERHDYKNQYGKDKIDFLVKGQGSYTWINAEEPTEREVVQWAYYGQQGDDLSKAYGTALTYGERYFLLKYFGLPTDEDDPDMKQGEHKKESYSKPKSNSEPPKRKVTATELIAMAAKKGYDEDKLKKKYNVSDVKYIKADVKIEAYDKFKALPDKS